MKKSTKIFILVVTLLPFLSMFLTIISFARFIFSRDVRELEQDNFYLESELLILWLIAMSAFYFFHIFARSGLTKGIKIAWAVLVVLFNMFVMPVYWCIYIWPERSANAGSGGR